MAYYIHLVTGLREHRKRGNGGMHCRKREYIDDWMAGGISTLYNNWDNEHGFEGLFTVGRLSRTTSHCVGGAPQCIGQGMAFCN